ncbi:hypothetical protein CFC21_110733 [Triticum aestivum]|uniref:Flavin-containing monooxygenase n=4 Tax=Triticinae TaxID=1648030 RepID=A0A3B6TPF3_WHEAT|nr:hypothetical protein CFC21_110733 [Triticum aestivum]
MATHSPQPTSKKVCIVGAGMAGLAAVRELRREGHAVTVLEQSHDVGGQWLYDPRTDDADPLGAAAPVRVHSSMYDSLRLMSPREAMGFSDFPFASRDGAGAGCDPRRFPGHREVYCYLKDFCDAFGLVDAIRLNTRAVRIALAPPCDVGSSLRWQVRAVQVEPESNKEVSYTEEVFDAVVVATGHYSQPKLPSIDGMEQWRRTQLHSHSYRTPGPFCGETVVVVGCGESGTDIAVELTGVAREVHLAARSMEVVSPGLSKAIARHDNLHLHLGVERLREDGAVVFADGSSAVADTVIYCTGYSYSFPFLETEGRVTVDDNRVDPLFEHVFPASPLAPSLSFVGIPIRVIAPWFFEGQARWVARVLSGRSELPTEAEMVRSVEAQRRAREAAGVPNKLAHDICGVEPHQYMSEFGERWCGFPRLESWKIELFASSVKNMAANFETFRDEYEDSDTVREALKEWRRSSGVGARHPEEEEDADAAEAMPP